MHRPSPDARPIEAIIGKNIAKRSLVVAPILIAIFAITGGWLGAVSAAIGVAIVVANFVLAAALLAGSARISPALMMFAALFGYLVRLSLIFLAIWLVRDASWIELVPFGITVIVSHLGLLLWEMRFISASLAYPALKPTATSHPASKESSSQ